MDAGTQVAMWVGVFLAFAVYIFPLALAYHRGCKASAGIAVVNVFLGWTFVGWVIALAWAASGELQVKAVEQVGEASQT